MERVLGLDAHEHEEGVSTEVINLATQPWLVGMMVSAVQLSVERLRPRRAPTSRQR
jgi:hypothetical protein